MAQWLTQGRCSASVCRWRMSKYIALHCAHFRSQRTTCVLWTWEVWADSLRDGVKWPSGQSRRPQLLEEAIENTWVDEASPESQLWGKGWDSVFKASLIYRFEGKKICSWMFCFLCPTALLEACTFLTQWKHWVNGQAFPGSLSPDPWRLGALQKGGFADHLFLQLCCHFR